MKKAAIWTFLTCLLVISLVLSSCGSSTTTTTTAATSSTTTKTTTSTVSQTTTKTTSTVSTSPTTALSGKWWDKLGKPVYGGDLVISKFNNIGTFDGSAAASTPGSPSIQNCWQERLVADDWTVDPAVFNYPLAFRPDIYLKGALAESWSFPDPSTFVVKIRQGIKWQNIPPMNGRDFVAADVAYTFHRDLGGGDGFTAPTPYFSTVANYKPLVSVTATDKYTVEFKWSISNPEMIMETLTVAGSECIVPPEAVKQWGDLMDWHHAVGTGPFILNDFVSGASATLVRNPTYWGNDERYPQNQLPYIDRLKILIIPDFSTELAGLRTGKIDAMDALTLEKSLSIQKSNPEILQVQYPYGSAYSVDPRNDKAPFSDIKVRKALQMSLDLPTIAKSFYGGAASPDPSGMTSAYLAGWGWPYAQWPQDLKDEYAYNPTAAKKLLSDAGFPNGFTTNCVAHGGGDLDLLQIVKGYFANIGVNMTIQTMDSASWTSYVRTAQKADALIYNASGSLGISFEPLRQFNRFLSTGGTINWAMIRDPNMDAIYAKMSNATSLDDNKKAIRDGNELVVRQHYLISLLVPNYFAAYQPWLKGFSGQIFALTGEPSPLFMGFYASRFWIDAKLKKSLGH